MKKKIEVEIIKLFKFFHSFLKFTGFIIVRFDTSIIWWCINIVSLLLNYLTAFGCSLRSEMWCLQMFDSFFHIKKFILFVIIQIVALTPLLMLVMFRLFNYKFIEIMLHASRIQNKLNCGMMTLNFGIMKVFGVLIFMVMLIVPIVTIYVTVVLTLPVSIFIDSVCMVYFEFWTTVPCAQFLNWNIFLSYILRCIQNEVVSGKTIIYGCDVKISKEFRHRIRDREKCESSRVRLMVNVIAEVLNIAKEISSAYGITVLIYIVHYLSRVIIQFYDVIDKDAQKFPMWMAAWNVVVRIIFILPVFVCCEHLTYNINKTVQLIQEIVTLHQPSCLDCIFQSLTLRLQHQNTTTQICGFLNITYRSFLTIMTTALAFLLLQLQF